MTPAEIKRKRTESLLVELIPEALAQLNDNRLHEIDVIEVVCSKGRSDCKVYLDPSVFTEAEQNVFLTQLSKARPLIETYIQQEQGWYRSPKLTFAFDDQLEKSQNIEALFDKIAKERHHES
jgi:ribosome-binding factor A